MAIPKFPVQIEYTTPIPHPSLFLVCPRVFFPSWTCLKYLYRKSSRRHPEPHHLYLPNTKEQRFNSKLPKGVWTPHLLTPQRKLILVARVCNVILSITTQSSWKLVRVGTYTESLKLLLPHSGQVYQHPVDSTPLCPTYLNSFNRGSNLLPSRLVRPLTQLLHIRLQTSPLHAAGHNLVEPHCWQKARAYA